MNEKNTTAVHMWTARFHMAEKVQSAYGLRGRQWVKYAPMHVLTTRRLALLLFILKTLTHWKFEWSCSRHAPRGGGLVLSPTISVSILPPVFLPHFSALGLIGHFWTSLALWVSLILSKTINFAICDLASCFLPNFGTQGSRFFRTKPADCERSPIQAPTSTDRRISLS